MLPQSLTSNIFPKKIRRNRSMKVIVRQGKSRISNTTIATYWLSSCYLFLLNGYYGKPSDNRPFAYLNHHDKWFEPGAEPPIDLLVSFLEEFVQFFKETESSIGGGWYSRLLDIDPLKDAFSFLVGPTKSTCNEIQSMLDDDEKYLFNKLLNHTTILTGFTYLLTDEEEDRSE